MKRLSILAAVLFALVLSPSIAHAQSTSVQQSGSRLDAATNVQHSHTSAATLTIPAGTGYAYIVGIDIVNCAGGTAVTAAAPTFITTTNISGSPQYMVGSGVTAGLCTSSPVPVPVNGIRSTAPNTATTFVLPTFATNQTVSVNVYYYYAAQ